MNKLLALIKVAGNPKVKRYWQMLKRLYGGTDDTVKELSKSRNFGIYHGTTKENAEKILKDKMIFRKNPDRELSYDGNYFGDVNAGNYFKEVRSIFPKKQDSSLLRFKYPNELKKNENYPKPTSMYKFKNNELKSFRYDYDSKIIDPANKPKIKIPTKKENIKEYRKAKFYGKYKNLKGNLMHGRFYNKHEDNQFLTKTDIPGNLLKETNDKYIKNVFKHRKPIIPYNNRPGKQSIEFNKMIQDKLDNQ